MMMKATNQKRRRGLTLLELVIVMTILVAVAGVMVAVFPSLLTQGHATSTITNVAELSKAIQMYNGVHFDGYPDRMDPLTVGTALYGNLACDGTVPKSGTPHGLGLLTLTQEHIDALAEAGIEEVTVMADSGTNESYHVTFHPYATEVPTFATIATGDTLPLLDDAANGAANAIGLGLDPDATYIAMGLGSPCRMFGKMALEAPVHYPDTKENNPNDGYARFVAIYQITASDGTLLSKARFRAVGALCGCDGVIGGIGTHSKVVWEDRENL